MAMCVFFKQPVVHSCTMVFFNQFLHKPPTSWSGLQMCKGLTGSVMVRAGSTQLHRHDLSFGPVVSDEGQRKVVGHPTCHMKNRFQLMQLSFFFLT